MRHKKKRTLELSTGVQRKDNVVRNMLTNLVINGKMITTPKRAKVLKAEADSLFARLVKISKKYDEKGAKRETDRVVKSILYSDEAGKRAIGEFLPRYIDEKRETGFVTDYKLGARPGDNAEKVLVTLI